MFEQAAGFALLAALSPPALLIVTFYLGSASPRRTILYFLAGGLVIAAVVGAVIIVALHAGGLHHPSQRQPRYALRLGLGVVALGVSVVVARRRPKPPDPNKKPGLITRLMSRPAPLTAFAAGLLVFTPSAAFIAAVQTVGTAQASTGTIVAAMLLVIAIAVMFAWIPLALHLIAPDATARRMKAADNWLRLHSHTVIVAVLVLVGVLLVADGIVGLTT